MPDIHSFDRSMSGVPDLWPSPSDPPKADYLEAYFDNSVMQLIFTEINKYYSFTVQHNVYSPHSRVRWWEDTHTEEMYVFFGLLLLMPHIEKHVLTDYWKK